MEEEHSWSIMVKKVEVYSKLKETGMSDEKAKRYSGLG